MISVKAVDGEAVTPTIVKGEPLPLTPGPGWSLYLDRGDGRREYITVIPGEKAEVRCSEFLFTMWSRQKLICTPAVLEEVGHAAVAPIG